jgi:hypothetical protein
MLRLAIGFRLRPLTKWSLGCIMGQKSHEKDRKITLRGTEKM